MNLYASKALTCSVNWFYCGSKVFKLNYKVQRSSVYTSIGFIILLFERKAFVCSKVFEFSSLEFIKPYNKQCFFVINAT